MRWFHNRSIGFKLLGSYVLLCALVGLVGLIGLRSMDTVKTGLHSVAAEQFPSMKALFKAKDLQVRTQRDLLNALVSQDAQERADLIAKLPNNVQQSRDFLASYKALPMSDEEKALIGQLDAPLAAWEKAIQRASAELSKNTPEGDQAALEIFSKEAKPGYSAQSKVINPLADLQEKYAGEATAAADNAADMGSKTLLVVFILGTLLTLGVGVVMTRYISQPLRTMTVAADQIATGDLDQDIVLERGDEIGQAAAAFRRMIGYQREMAAVADMLADGDLTVAVVPRSERDRFGMAFETLIANWQELVGQVKGSAESLADTSAQIGQAANQTSGVVQQVTLAIQSVAGGAQETSRSAQHSNEAVSHLGQAIDNVAQGAQDQARQIQVASETTTRMAASIDQVAGNAQAVAAASQQTKASAEHGAQAVRETVAGMAEITQVVADAARKVEDLGKLGEKIGAVVETIDDIAEQTNLLALNAAIEAARAGEHGRGFAVVADEVRKLAERSQRETKAISELIREVQSGTKDAVEAMEVGSAKVEQGTVKADQAGASLSEILTAVDATVGQVSGIAAAAQEVAAGARSVVDAMSSISAVVEESSAGTEEMAAQAGLVTTAIQSIASVSEENSASAEQVSASAEEMSAQVEEMSAQADELAQTADQLRALVARFRLGEADGTAPVLARRRADDWEAGRAMAAARRAS